MCCRYENFGTDGGDTVKLMGPKVALVKLQIEYFVAEMTGADVKFPSVEVSGVSEGLVDAVGLLCVVHIVRCDPFHKQAALPCDRVAYLIESLPYVQQLFTICTCVTLLTTSAGLLKSRPVYHGLTIQPIKFAKVFLPKFDVWRWELACECSFVVPHLTKSSQVETTYALSACRSRV
jgi:hypothetical protein